MKRIGVFDSGYGGLTILKDIQRILPEYDYIYLGDNARAPYGTRSFDVVYQFTLQAVKKLFELNCDLVILACNTASAKALRTIQQNDLPVIAPDKKVLGVIRPTAEQIGKFTSSNVVGILGTPGTVSSESYLIEIQKQFPNIKVLQKACPLWVPLIENNKHQSSGGQAIIQEDYLELLQMDKKMDAVLLACTHYPIIQEQLQAISIDKIQLVSQGQIVARSLKDYLSRHKNIDAKLLKNGVTTYLTTENPEIFNRNALQFVGSPILALHTQIDTIQ